MRFTDTAALVALAEEGPLGLCQALDRILEHPHRDVVVDTPLVELEELTEPDTERFLDLITDPRRLLRARYPPVHMEYEGRQFQFTHVYDARTRVTFDTYPNRFVRHFVDRYRDALKHAPPSEASRRLLKRLDATIQGSVLHTVSPLHHLSVDHNVLRKDPSYREVLRCSVSLARLATRGSMGPPEDE